MYTHTTHIPVGNFTTTLTSLYAAPAKSEASYAPKYTQPKPPLAILFPRSPAFHLMAKFATSSATPACFGCAAKARSSSYGLVMEPEGHGTLMQSLTHHVLYLAVAACIIYFPAAVAHALLACLALGSCLASRAWRMSWAVLSRGS